MANKNVGSSFESFLEEEGIKEEVYGDAIKRVISWQIEQEMKSKGLSKTAMAKTMKTSRAQLDRVLDPKNDKVQLDAMAKAAHAVGRKLVLELA